MVVVRLGLVKELSAKRDISLDKHSFGKREFQVESADHSRAGDRGVQMGELLRRVTR